MSKVLKTIDMEATPLVFSNVYLNVPGGEYPLFLENMIKAVETIGEKYGTVSGSPLKKGIKYIQKETGCPSTRQIKMMLRNVNNARLRLEHDSAYVFRCSMKYYTAAFKCIVEKANISLPGGGKYSDFLIPDPKNGLQYVSVHGRTNSVRNIANNMYNEVDF